MLISGGINMNEKTIEMMKKLIEEKKQKGNKFGNSKKADKVIGKASKGKKKDNSKGTKIGDK
jgi:hypothetical protein